MYGHLGVTEEVSLSRRFFYQILLEKCIHPYCCTPRELHNASDSREASKSDLKIKKTKKTSFSTRRIDASGNFVEDGCGCLDVTA
jgi:hypothetical protein